MFIFCFGCVNISPGKQNPFSRNQSRKNNKGIQSGHFPSYVENQSLLKRSKNLKGIFASQKMYVLFEDCNVTKQITPQKCILKSNSSQSYSGQSK